MVIAVTMPNFLIIGAQKAGTTPLYHYLKQHPQIYMSPLKEPHFFSYEGERLSDRGPGHGSTDPVVDIDDYRALFRGVTQETAIGEASPSYIYVPRAAKRIQRHIPDAKLIAVLRHPAERAYSNYLHSIWLGQEPCADFSEALREEETGKRNGWGALWHYKGKGFYFNQLKRFFDIFDRDRIRVYLHEDMYADPVGVLRDSFRFLEVDETFVPEVSARLNVSGVPKNKLLHSAVTRLNRPLLRRFVPAPLLRELREPIRKRILAKPPQLPPETRRQLTEAYREDILKLQDLIHRDLSEWLV